MATPHDWLTASIKVVRDRIIDQWIESTKEAYERQEKRVYYLSLEFLIGRLMRDAFSNLGLLDAMRQALASLGVDLDVIARLEPDAALGNGGLGRLAACFMESMATVDVPAHGYGIRYANGMFRQEISDGWQVELPETWLEHGNPWEFERRERSFEVGFGGAVESVTSKDGRLERHVWKPTERVLAVAYRHAGGRLARQARQHAAAVVGDARSTRSCSTRSTPATTSARCARATRRRRCRACSIPPIRTRPDRNCGCGRNISSPPPRCRTSSSAISASMATCMSLPDKAAIHLNDTHPAIAVAELMRLLMDVHGMDFDKAWDITKRTFAYTNHTLLPEALESWPVPLFERLLPRHMQIIYAINAAGPAGSARDRPVHGRADRPHLADPGKRRAARAHGQSRLRRLALDQRRLGAAHGADEGDGVCRPRTGSIPDRINNKTNGITPRRWLIQCNPGLTELAQGSDRRPLPRRSRRLKDLDALRRRCRVPREVRRGQAGQQGAARHARR